MEEVHNNERNKMDNVISNDNKEWSIGGSGFSLPSPDDKCKGGIDSVIGGGLLIASQLSSDTINEDSNSNITPGIRADSTRMKMKY